MVLLLTTLVLAVAVFWLVGAGDEATILFEDGDTLLTTCFTAAGCLFAARFLQAQAIVIKFYYK